MEKRDIKKGQHPPAKGNQVTFKTIKLLSSAFTVVKLYQMMTVSRSAYHAWLNRPTKLITS